MFTRWATGLLILICSTASVFSNVYAQTVGGPPAQLRGKFWTEESWIVAEIVSDVTEMAAYATKPSAKPLSIDVESIRPGLFRLSVDEDRIPAHELDLNSDLWDHTRFAAVARLAIGKNNNPETGIFHTPVHRTLLDLTPDTLTRVSGELSRELSAHMRSASLHEAAALTLGAFALRESSGRFNDVRWALNRMTAHLAMAHALSNGKPDLDGRLAEAVRLTLSGQQTLALAVLRSLGAGTDPESVRSWRSALHLRITEDWRELKAPWGASRLEQQEYLRARRATVPATSSLLELERLKIDPEDSADWIRILQNATRDMAVEEGRLVTEGLGLAVETREFMEVFGRLHRQSTMASVDALNARASRCVVNRQVNILPWGAWAEQAQRHLAMLGVNTDRVKRYMLATHDDADAAKTAFDSAFGSLSMLPIASIFRGKGKGSEYDLAHINAAVAFAVASPERVSPFVWQWLERSAPREFVTQTMPPKRKWFFGPSERLPLEAGARWSSLGTIEAVTATWRVAPHDYLLSTGAIRRQFGNPPTQAGIAQFLGARLQYDTRAIYFAMQYTPNDAATVSLLEQACNISAASCVGLGDTFVRLARPDAAARSYERAFASPEVSEVHVANASRWLVMHYQETGQVERALALAERSAKAYSGQGLTTAALLYERLHRFEDAEQMFKAVAERYDITGRLLGFYYRMVHQRGQSRFEAPLQSTVTALFPSGLQATPPSSSSAPLRGVIIHKDNVDMVKAGFQAGDIIVALEGYRVESLEQYEAINEAFREKPEMTFTMWRGSNFERKITVPKREIDLELRSHPITGF
jgi:tetratricopeptide (TPR) repeat protein